MVSSIVAFNAFKAPTGIVVMKSGDSMEGGGIWIPLTPGKLFPANSGRNCDTILNSEKRIRTENINEPFPCMSPFNTMRFMEKCGMNEKRELPAGFLIEDEAVLGLAEKDRKSSALVQNDTSCVQKETINISPSDGKKAQGVDEPQTGFGSVPTPKTKESRKRRNDDIDLNKKPSPRPRVKKHRPKVYDDSKPKKVPKAQTPWASTPKPKTPTQRKTKFTGSTSGGLENVVPDVQKASKTSIVDVKSCKRSLNFEYHNEPNSHEEHLQLSFDLGKYIGKIVTAKRNTLRRNRFQKTNLEASVDLLKDTNEQKHGQDISVISNQEQFEKKDRRYVYFYQRRKKINSNVTKVYQRSFRENQCLQNSKRCGPIFPKIFKKRRRLRKKLIIKPVEDGKIHVKQSNTKLIQTTGKKEQNTVNKSKETRVLKPVLHANEWDRRVFSPPTRNRSIRHSRLRENIMDLIIFKEMPFESEKYLLCQEENFLQIMEYRPHQEVPVHRIEDFQRVDNSIDNLNRSQLQEVSVHKIESFTSQYRDFEEVDNSVGNLNLFQLQKVPIVEVVKSQSLVSTQEEVFLEAVSLPCGRELNKLYVREILPFIIGRLASLDISCQCKELVVRNINFSGALAKIIPPKKRKVLPKVDLDHETLRVWKLLMENDGSEPVEEMNKDKEEWWERQRETFRGRVDSFISKMHLIQGDRRFSPWKGSVTDSVVGAYLSQNVGDHLSSSAFMSVAARFPVKTRCNDVVDHGEIVSSQESVTSYAKVGQRFSRIMEIEDMSTSCDGVSIHDKPCVNGNTNSFRKLLEIEEVDFLKQFCRLDDEGKEDQSASFFNFQSSSNEPSAITFDLNVGLCETSESELTGQQKSTLEEEPIVLTPVCSLQSEVTIERESEFTGQQKSNPEEELIVLTPVCSLQSEVSIEQESEFIGQQKSTPEEEPIAFAPVCSLQSEVTIMQESEFTGQQKSTREEEPIVPTPVCSHQSEVTIEQESEFTGQQKSTPEVEPIAFTPIWSLQSEVTIEQGVNAVNNHQKMTETPLESGSMKKKQEIKTDWEELRRKYCKTGGKETNENNMDAVDWDAVRRAPVKELAETIAERGMNNVLAARIKDFLNRMYKDHGSLDLEWLRDVPPDKAKEFLLSIDGIGLKSVECIRLLTLHHLAFPVDTNVGRVATRLGWVPLQPLPEHIQIHLLNAYPMVDTIQKYLFPRLYTLDQKTLYELHYQLITFGKVFCTKRKPNCNACPMRGECRHYASEFASGRLALPAPKESSRVTSIVPAVNEQNKSILYTPSSSSSSCFDPKVNNAGSSYHGQTCEPIIECPPSPVPEVEETLIGDIEDLFCDSDDEIPTIRLNTQEFRETLKDTIGKSNISIPDADMSKALVTLSAEAANVRVPLKFVARLRTMHLVYELPDLHPILAGFDRREHDDPTPYLLKIWLPVEIPKSSDHTENRACDSTYTNREETHKGTILIPCRTANRGSFPLNGTYFQVNEVFADDETSLVPIDVPRSMLWNLSKRELGCGSSATSIFKGLPTAIIQRLFWKGSICVRGFNRKTRTPQSLDKKLHATTTTIAGENKKSGKR